MTPMRVRTWVNWGLILAAVGSVGAVIATQNEWTSAERAARASHLVVGFREAEIGRVRISTNGQVLELVRAEDEGLGAGARSEADEHDARWVFVEPYQGEAEEATVDALLHALQYAPFIRKVTEESFDRRAAGLDPPKQTIELFTESVRTRVHLGGAALAPANAHYVEIGGEGTANKGIYVVSDTTADALLVNLDEFRVRQIVPYGASGLKAVTLTDGKERSVVLRAGDAGDWRLDVDQRGVRVEEAAVRRLFAALARSRVERFVSDMPSEGPLSAGQVQVTLEPKAGGKPTLSFRFGGECPTEPTLRLALRVGDAPLAGCTVPLHLDTFVDQLPEMVERRLFGFSADMVERLTLRASERTLEIARRDEAWVMFEPRSGPVERDVGEAFVESILEVRGELTSKPSGELVLLGQVTITKPHLEDEIAAPEVVELYASAPATVPQPGVVASGLFARRVADDAWLELPARERRLFQPNALLLRSTQLVNAEAAQVSRVRIQTGEWTQSFEYRSHDVGCQLTEPAGYTADSALCLDHIDELRLLRARSWVAESDDGTFGLANPTLRATFSVEPPKGEAPDASTSELTLTVGHRTADGGYYAQLSSDPAVFTLRQGVVDVLRGLVVDRSPFILDAANIQSLVITRGMGASRSSLTMRRLGGDLVQVGQDGARATALDEGAQTELLDALSLLRPEAAVTLLDSGRMSNAPRTYGFDAPLLEVEVRTRTEAGDRDYHWVVGRADVHRNVSVHYALPITSGRSAVFALPRQGIQRILDAL